MRRAGPRASSSGGCEGGCGGGRWWATGSTTRHGCGPASPPGPCPGSGSGLLADSAAGAAGWPSGCCGNVVVVVVVKFAPNAGHRALWASPSGCAGCCCCAHLLRPSVDLCLFGSIGLKLAVVVVCGVGLQRLPSPGSRSCSGAEYFGGDSSVELPLEGFLNLVTVSRECGCLKCNRFFRWALW